MREEGIEAEGIKASSKFKVSRDQGIEALSSKGIGCGVCNDPESPRCGNCQFTF